MTEIFVWDPFLVSDALYAAIRRRTKRIGRSSPLLSVPTSPTFFYGEGPAARINSTHFSASASRLECGRRFAGSPSCASDVFSDDFGGQSISSRIPVTSPKLCVRESVQQRSCALGVFLERSRQVYYWKPICRDTY